MKKPFIDFFVQFDDGSGCKIVAFNNEMWAHKWVDWANKKYKREVARVKKHTELWHEHGEFNYKYIGKNKWEYIRFGKTPVIDTEIEDDEKFYW